MGNLWAFPFSQGKNPIRLKPVWGIYEYIYIYDSCKCMYIYTYHIYMKYVYV